MKTLPMEHQKVGEQRLLAAPEYYALGAEQGTGKTWMILNDAERQYAAGLIQGLLVIAPKGVHTNWIRREIPAHMSCAHRAEFWLSGAGKRHSAQLEKLLGYREGLAILAMNVDALNTKSGYAFAKRFLQTFRSMMTVDESQRIKNPAAQRTKKAIALGRFAHSRRICSGTLVSNSPLDLFSQYDFLREGLLGTTSYRAFVAEFAELLPPDHYLVRSIQSRYGTPQIVKRTEDGMPIYKNLSKLQELISPHTFRVLKKDCLDLPEKIYQTQYFELTPAQMQQYRKIQSELRHEYPDGNVDTYTALTIITKLRQITSGFIMREGEPVALTESAPRLQALKEIVEDADGQIIIWASYREEIRQIAAALKDYGVVEYHGGITAAQREKAVDAFQNREVRIFVAHPAAGGTGLTLHAAETVIYHSCSFSLEERKQSEDRAHRIGTKKNVLYIDIAAVGTIDEKIAAALQAKAGVAAAILDGII